MAEGAQSDDDFVLPDIGDVVLDFLMFGSASHSEWKSSLALRAPHAFLHRKKAEEAIVGVYVDTSGGRSKKRRTISQETSERPSIVNLVKDLIEKRHTKGHIPFYTPSKDPVMRSGTCLIEETYKQCITELNCAVIPDAETGRKVMSTLPLSHVSHDNRMLEFDRRSRNHPDILAPYCLNSDDRCAAVQIACVASKLSTSPLQVYMTPSEEEDFNKTGRASDGFCLLCIRSSVASQALANFGIGGPIVVPPMTVPVNCANGYRRECCLGPEDGVAGYIPRPSGQCVVKYNQEQELYYVDQGNIQWFPSPISPLN